MTPHAGDGNEAVGRLLRELAPQVLGAVARRHGDFAAAEDAVQEALIAAADQWARDGVPKNPRGWLYHVALRRMTDRIRAEVARRRREDSVASGMWAEWAFVPPADVALEIEQDDSLTVLFMCCHPSLTPASAIALTLRAVGGLTTAEIASAFLVPEATMAQRISRAKATIRASGAGFEQPDSAERGARLASVMHVLYLMFNEGYATSRGDVLARADLSSEAIRLARLLRELVPDDPEVAGLLALMLLTDARRAARTGQYGELIPLDQQDRALWDRSMIREGIALAETAVSHGGAGPYRLQAAIAALHDEATSTETTDWRQIAALYDALLALADNPMVALNRAIAVAMVDGPAAGLALLDTLATDGRIASHHRLTAARAHLLDRAGQKTEAIEWYRHAAENALSTPERDFLLMKAARLAEDA